MSTAVGRWTPEVARRRFDELERSGMSVVAFSTRLGVSPQRFVYWRNRLARETSLAEPQFVELTVREAPRSAPAVEVRFPSGHTVSVAPGTATLAEVLELVDGLSC